MPNPDAATRSSRARWAVPITGTVIGIAYLVVGSIGGHPGFGVFGLVLMLVVVGLFVWGGRHSETLAFLASRRDERINAQDRDASHLAGMVVLYACLAMFMYELARGRDGSPYFQLAALGGLTYVVGLVWMRLRG